MGEIGERLRIHSLRALLARRQEERAFLAERSDCDDLSHEQQATILYRIDRINEQTNMLQWILSLLQREQNFASEAVAQHSELVS
jgi:hypothetical protein